jgi:hypothetical protein
LSSDPEAIGRMTEEILEKQLSYLRSRKSGEVGISAVDAASSKGFKPMRAVTAKAGKKQRDVSHETDAGEFTVSEDAD